MIKEKKWKREISAGGIVYKKQHGRVFILLVKPTQSQRQPDDPKWGFPKGHIGDKLVGEKPEQAALREVAEEGGVETKIVEKLGSIKYNFVWESENIFKIVTFYLMEYVSGN